MNDQHAEFDNGWLLAVARGDTAADLVIRGANVFMVHTKEWLAADVLVARDRIAAVVERDADDDGAGPGSYGAARIFDARDGWLTPGLIDAHLHVESSKVTVDAYAAAVAPRGTTAIVAEPHEIGNVLGARGVRWFMDACENLPIDVFTMIPSCVPASAFETGGATIGVDDMRSLLEHPRAIGVGELMNFPAVIAGEPEQLRKVTLPGSTHVDGHAPGVRGRALDAYVAAGIGSDHESTSIEEALDKRRRGMWIFLREASNARNLIDLLPMVREYGPEWCALCTDDREPDELVRDGHIDAMLRTCVEHGVSAEDALLMATLHPALAHQLAGHGSITPGARANLVIFDDMTSFVARAVFSGGTIIAEDGALRITPSAWAPGWVRNTVRIPDVPKSAFEQRLADGERTSLVTARVIGARDGQLLTDHLVHELVVRGGVVQPDPEADVARLAVVERHSGSGQISTGFVHGFGILDGAFASTVAHDAHNIVVAGIDTASMQACVQRLAQLGGGIVTARSGVVTGELALPVAGLMSDQPADVVADQMDELHAAIRELGVTSTAPFMVLSFLALSVIPSLKLTEQGLIDVEDGAVVPVIVSTNPTLASR